jgi:hypothetical protein
MEAPMKKRQTLFQLFSLFVAASLLAGPAVIVQPAQAMAPQPVTATSDKATLLFPSQITFSVELAGATPIKSVTLEYSVDQLTCGTVKAKAMPTFKAGKNVKAAWTWKMEDSGSLPPGAQVHWQWRVIDANGTQLLTSPHQVTWLDDQHKWQTLSSRKINLHWYRGGEDFGRRMQSAAQNALTAISQKYGLQPDKPIDLYLYADGDEMRQAVFYKPDWTGGVAYPTNSIAIIGIAPADEAWGKRAVAHEITHIVVDTYGFSCLGSRPTWLDEGLATYIEGSPTSAEQKQLETALSDDELLALSALDAGFAKDDYTVSLAYIESYSLVNFLITQYGREKLLIAMDLLRDGATTKAALTAAYGFDELGLENAWRARLGAKPHGANTVPLAVKWPADGPTLGLGGKNE